MNDNFVHLHGHDCYSLLDGLGKPEETVEKVKKIGQIAVAQTNHGFCGGYLKFYFAAKKAEIKPIIGVEAYIVDDMSSKDRASHITLLAKNKDGMRNIFKLISIANLKGFYYVPRIDAKKLFKYGDGIIVLSGCLGGYFSKKILNGKKVDDELLSFKKRFKDDFYIEVMPHELEEQKQLNEELLKLSIKHDIPLVATQDFHYTDAKDTKIHNILIMINRKTTIESKDKKLFSVNDLYIKTREEMKQAFKKNTLWKEEIINKALDETVNIANKCNIELSFDKYVFPKVKIPSKFKDSNEYLEHLCKKGLTKRGLSENDKYIKQLEHELKIVKEREFSDYFIIVQDFINWAKGQKIPMGPGRGSAAGSLIAYLLRITEIDPLKYDLLFERFINPLRAKIPDIDTDVSDIHRTEVKDYLTRTYGANGTANIGAYSLFTPNNCLRDVARTQCIDFNEVNAVAKTIFTTHEAYKDYATIDDNLALEIDNKPLKHFAEKYPEVIEAVRKIQLQPRHFTVAAGGVLITNKLTNYTALRKTNKGVATELDKFAIEKDMKLLKMDVLGLKTLTVLDNTLKQINKDFDFLYNLEIKNDKKILNNFCEGNTDGVFQLESSSMRGLLKEIKPANFEELIILEALYRPAVISSGMLKSYIKRKNGEEIVEYFHPILEKQLSKTYGIIVFQEQLIYALCELGLDISTADLIRNEMQEYRSKKFEPYLKQIYEKNTTLPKKEIKAIIDYLIKHAGYAFNKSHSTAYSAISWYCMYLKTYYPLEYMLSLLNVWIKDDENLRMYIKATRNMNIKIKHVDINKSDIDFIKTSSDSIRMGMSLVKNVGVKAITNIIENRPYTSFDDFIKKVTKRTVNKRVIEKLIKARAFSSIDKKAWKKYIQYYKIENPEHYNKIKFETDAFGFYMSRNFLNKYAEKLKKHGYKRLSYFNKLVDGDVLMSAAAIKSIREHETKRKKKMMFVDLDDGINTLTMLVWSKQMEDNKEILKEGNLIFFKLKKSKDVVILDSNGEINLLGD